LGWSFSFDNLCSSFFFFFFHEICIDYVIITHLGSSDAIIQLSKIDDLMKEEAIKLREVIDVLHLKHKEYIEKIQTCISSHSFDESEIKRLAGL
jgi:cupin superfamily acireductone dioxygenase involved in methionine salvage